MGLRPRCGLSIRGHQRCVRIKLKAQDILDAIQGLDIQTTAGVDSVTKRLLRNMYENSLEQVERTLLPIFNAVLSGCLNKQQCRLMRTGRLVLLAHTTNTAMRCPAWIKY